MITINVTQGSAEWHELRATKMTASEAPAMMGDSKYLTRAKLLHQKATGEVPEVTPAQQRIFDKGHAAEDAARPLAESIIDDELFPSTAISDEYDWMLASFDGVTMLDDVVFEHKLLNKHLIYDVQNKCLDLHYVWQLEQQLLVSGAEKAIFMCSNLTDGSEPVEGENYAYCFYESDPKRREALIAGWHQFMKDLSEYQAPEKIEAVEAEPIRDLPAIRYQMNGLTLDSNLSEYKAAVEKLVEDSKAPLETDQDFANAQELVKKFKNAETNIKAITQQVLGEVADIDQFTKDLNYIGEQIRQARLAANKQVEERKKEIRKEIHDAADRQIGDHERAIEEELNAPAPSITVSVANALKGKKKLDSLQDAANDAVAKAKIELDGYAEIGRQNKAYLAEHAAENMFLFNDWAQLAFTEPSAFEAIVAKRIADHQKAEEARLEAERERIRQEEARKAEEKAQAEAKASAEQAATTQQAPTQANEHQQSAAPAMQKASELSQGPSTKQQLESSTVSISMREYRYLQQCEAELEALKAHGVDNWSGYCDAMASLNDRAA